MAKTAPPRLQLICSGALLDVLRSCEVHCVAGCCGLAAFEFRAQHITSVLRERGCEVGREALDQLERLVCLVGKHKGAVLSPPDELNEGWRSGRQCLALLRTWQMEILAALRRVTRGRILDPAWLRWNDGAVLSLARTIQREKGFRSLPVLGDALEEAGCRDEALLTHCRELRDHLDRCWVVELLARRMKKYG